MPRLPAPMAALAALISFVPLSDASAHCFVGSRFFPATLNVDDPCVADELSLPTISVFKNEDVPSAQQLDISGEFSKRITENLGVSIESTWTRIRPPIGPTANGFQNLESTLKYQFLTDPTHELVLSAALSVEWGNTGAAQVGANHLRRRSRYRRVDVRCRSPCALPRLWRLAAVQFSLPQGKRG